MTSKELVTAVINDKPFDRVPVIALGAGGWITNHENLSYRQLYDLPDSGASLIVSWADIFGSDTVTSAIGVFTAYLNAFGCPLEIDKQGAPAEVGAAITDKDPTDGIRALTALTPEQIRAKLEANEFVQKMLNMSRHVKALTGDAKYLVGDIAGPFTAAGVIVGITTFIKMLKKKPELVEELLGFTTEAAAQMLKLLYECGTDFAMISDPTASGNMISDKMVERFVTPSVTALLKKIDYYPLNGVHICGESRTRLEPLRDAGAKTFSMDYVTDLSEAITVGGGSMKIIGNMNPVGKLLTGTPEEVYAEACDTIRQAEGRGFILAPGCDLGFQSTIENIQMMRKASDDLAG